jgi:hypothetical protein
VEKKMTNADAEALIRLWAERLDVNSDTEDFAGAVETLLPAVRSERLAFDEDAEVFKLKLLAPLVLEKTTKEMLEIKELTLEEKESVQKYKDNEGVYKIEAIYAKSAGLTLGEASKIKGRDFSVITALVTVFFS